MSALFSALTPNVQLCITLTQCTVQKPVTVSLLKVHLWHLNITSKNSSLRIFFLENNKNIWSTRIKIYRKSCFLGDVVQLPHLSIPYLLRLPSPSNTIMFPFGEGRIWMTGNQHCENWSRDGNRLITFQVLGGR